MNKVFTALFALSFWCLSASANDVKTDDSINTTAKSEVAFITTTSTSSHPVVAEKLTVDYKISVLGFFNSGTQFELPSLSKARLSRSSSFAINGNEVIDGNKYVTQIWQIDVVPEQSGFIEIPALTFSIHYKDAQGKAQKKTLVSDSVALFAYLPEPLQNVKDYIISSDVSVSEEWTGEKDSYDVGDVLSRDITLKAEDISSIQFPLLHVQSISGIKINQQEARLSDSNNRGQQTAMLQQTIHYTIQRAGNYQLAGEQLSWWNQDDGLQVAAFDVASIHVAGFSRLMMIYTSFITFVLLLSLFTFFRYKKRVPNIKSQLSHALKNKQWALFIKLLYLQLDQSSDISESDEVQLLKKTHDEKMASELLANEYKEDATSRPELTASQLKKLIK